MPGKTPQQPFELEVMGVPLKVTKHLVGRAVIYRVEYTKHGHKGLPLNLTMAAGENIGNFWTSVPEGRQKEADTIGPEIERYLKEQKRGNQGGEQHVLL